MLGKAIVAFLIGLHLLPSSFQPNKPIPSPTPNKLDAQINTSTANSLSIPEEVYADLAIQHELDHVSVYYFDGDSQNTVSVNADKNWDPASTIKLYAAMYAFDQASHGVMSLDQNVTVNAKNLAPSESYPNGYPALNEGDVVSVYRLVDQMITQSDNTAYNTLLDLLDRQEITKYIHDLGLTSSSVGAKLNLNDSQEQLEYTTPGFGPNLITADDYARAFILINGGRIPGSTDLFNILARQKLNSMIPALLPAGVTVAHKTGELDPYYHDGGIIVDPNKRYVLSIFSDLGDPRIVAHISDLVYTNDANLVGVNKPTTKTTGEILNTPVDPMVADQFLAGNSDVLAQATINVGIPRITASDLGINANDLSNSLDVKQLPYVIIPYNSPFHFLVDLGERIRTNFNPIPSLRVTYETQNMQLALAEARDMISKGNKIAASDILSKVNKEIASVAHDKVVVGNATLQKAIDQVSETRFSILGSEVASSTNADEKVQLIKNIAGQAVDAAVNVKPYVADAAKTTDLAQTPIVGQVVKTTSTSVTVRTNDGSQVTTSLPSNIKTRAVDQSQAQVGSPSQLVVGSTVALVNSFVLTDIASESANPTALVVVKVNLDANSMVVRNTNGTLQQVDLTPQTVIKGADTSVSFDQLKPGDVVIVHGEPLPATPSATPAQTSPFPSTSGLSSVTPLASFTPSTAGPNGTLLPSAVPVASLLPLVTPIPLATAPSRTTTTAKPQATTVPATKHGTTKGTPPLVIKGNVIQVVQTAPSPASPKPPTQTSVPATPAPTGEKK